MRDSSRVMTPAIFGLAGLELTADERAFFAEADPAGYILFARNCETPAQLRALTDDLRAIAGRDDLLVTIDQEGGRVARLPTDAFPKYPPGGAFDALYDVAPISAIEAARVNAHALALDLAEAGVTCNALPLLDVREPGAHDVIGDRALGTEPMRVAALGKAVLDGMADAGVIGIVKHIPGHGRATADSHKNLPTVTASDAELERDLAPFIALADAPLGMTAHIVFTAWDDARPATQSPTVIEDIIRARIGFDGFLMTDDIDMQALDGPIPERSAKAIAAGCDCILNCWAKMDDMVGIAKAVPAMTAKGRERLDRGMAGARIAPVGSIAERRDELAAKRDALLSAGGVAA